MKAMCFHTERGNGYERFQGILRADDTFCVGGGFLLLVLDSGQMASPSGRH